MDIKFTDKKLEKLANNDRKMLKNLGKFELKSLGCDYFSFTMHKISKKLDIYLGDFMNLLEIEKVSGLATLTNHIA